MEGLNPQQQKFKEGYLNPNSPTFGNAKGSAIEAGYTEDYADSITGQGTDWFSGILRDKKRLEKAEDALDEALQLDIRNSPDVDTNILDKKTKVAMFVAKGMAKEKYAERKEITGKDGGYLMPVDVEQKQKITNLINNVLPSDTTDHPTE